MKMKVMIAEKSDITFTNKPDTNCIYAAYAESYGHIIVVTKIPDEMADRGQAYGTVWLYADWLDNLVYRSESLQTLLEEMICDGLEVFEFESELDLAEWCIELFGEANTKVSDYFKKNEY
jgi:hypothetical protein